MVIGIEARAQALALLKWPDPFANFSGDGASLTIKAKPIFLGSYLLPHDPTRYPHPSFMSQSQRDEQIQEFVASAWRSIRHVTDRLTLNRQAAALCALAVRDGTDVVLKSTIRPFITPYFSGETAPIASGIPALAQEWYKYRISTTSPEWAPRFRALEILTFFGKPVPTIYENGDPNLLINKPSTWS